MIFVIIQLPPRMIFNPFQRRMDDLFDLFNDVKSIAKASLTPFVTSYPNQDKLQEQVNSLNSALSRFVLLEMQLRTHFDIPYSRNEFVESIEQATFHFGGLQRPIPRSHQPQAQPPSDPLAHVPKPAQASQDEAKRIAARLGDKLPEECYDPIAYESLTDPIEINNRVYNRETVAKLIKNGVFNDPFTRDEINPKEAKPAHYMLNAIAAHDAVLEGKRPSMLDTFKDTKVFPLIDLFEKWQETLRKPGPTPDS
jgi:U-box domain